MYAFMNSLVSYESSDDDVEQQSGNSLFEADKPPKRRKRLPKVPSSLTIPAPLDDPALHQGRVRSTPHVEGQFSAFVYVAVPLRKSAPLRALLEKSISCASEMEPGLVCDWSDDSSTTHTLHISLTRPIYLRHYQREDLKRAVKAAARTVLPFIASFSSFATFANDERTRAFLGIEVGAGHQELESLSKAIEPTLKMLHQKVFYSEPRFHASIAWALLQHASTSTSDIEKSITSISPLEPELQQLGTPRLPKPIPCFPSSLLPGLNSKFGHELSSTKIGVFEVDRIYVKIGKDVFSWPLGKE